jgi:hypothetical protein
MNRDREDAILRRLRALARHVLADELTELRSELNVARKALFDTIPDDAWRRIYFIARNVEGDSLARICKGEGGMPMDHLRGLMANGRKDLLEAEKDFRHKVFREALIRGPAGVSER